jgi:hypothetical protein
VATRTKKGSKIDWSWVFLGGVAALAISVLVVIFTVKPPALKPKAHGTYFTSGEMAMVKVIAENAFLVGETHGMCETIKKWEPKRYPRVKENCGPEFAPEDFETWWRSTVGPSFGPTQGEKP